jgi:hypothetical protein
MGVLCTSLPTAGEAGCVCFCLSMCLSVRSPLSYAILVSFVAASSLSILLSPAASSAAVLPMQNRVLPAVLLLLLHSFIFPSLAFGSTGSVDLLPPFTYPSIFPFSSSFHPFIHFPLSRVRLHSRLVSEFDTVSNGPPRTSRLAQAQAHSIAPTTHVAIGCGCCCAVALVILSHYVCCSVGTVRRSASHR